PRTKLLIAVIIVVLLLTAAGLIYNYGLNRAGFERQSAVDTQQSLRDQTRQLQDGNQKLQEALAGAQRTIQMDQAAYQDLDKSLKASAQEIIKLHEELDFYRNIISPADNKSGLHIQNLYIESAGSANQYHYKLVLIQALQHENMIQGRANFEISGLRAGNEVVLRIPTANEHPIAVSFKYFQDIEGKLNLPQNFQPKRVKVYITSPGGAPIAQTVYNWPLS
ncbi:MAG: DUF6776 family protein, partial [Sulfuricaulis sp.]